jgi:pimeloyl-ACP methyl ester carboxylesterase
LAHPARASVVVIPGRGEHENAGRFENVAFRLALDGYEVTLLSPGEDTVSALGETRVPGVPLVVVGSDTGALRAIVLAGSPALRLDALVLYGLPLLYRPVAGQLPAGALPRTLPDLPTLLVHGRDDEVSPVSLVRMTTRTAPRARLEVVEGGHQVLDEPGRRCVAALTLLFLEGVRTGPPRPIPEPAAG